MFQYKNSQIIAIEQINLGHNLNDNNEAVLFFDLFLFVYFFLLSGCWCWSVSVGGWSTGIKDLV